MAVATLLVSLILAKSTSWVFLTANLSAIAIRIKTAFIPAALPKHWIEPAPSLSIISDVNLAVSLAYLATISAALLIAAKYPVNCALLERSGLLTAAWVPVELVAYIIPTAIIASELPAAYKLPTAFISLGTCSK